MESQHLLISVSLWFQYQNRFNRMICLHKMIHNNQLIYSKALFVFKLLIIWLTLESFRQINKWSGLCMMMKLLQIKESGSQ